MSGFVKHQLIVGLFASFLLLPAHAQQTRSSGSSPSQLWTQYQEAPSTETGKNAGRNALRLWAVDSNLAPLRTAAENMSPASDLWPDLVQALSEAYRVSETPLRYRNGYETLLKTAKRRVTNLEGWLKVMIALGDYYQTAEQDRWAALNTYEEAYKHGGSRRLVPVLKKRIQELRFPEIGQPAPTFQVTTLADTTLNLANLRGDPVLLYFWARWCSPCLRKLPKLSALQSTSPSLHLLGLVIDENDRQKLRTYIDEENITWPQAVTDDWDKDSRSPQRRYGVAVASTDALGHTVLINRQGRIAAQGTDLEAIRDTLEAIVNR